jgi:hypothetical protein
MDTGTRACQPGLGPIDPACIPTGVIVFYADGPMEPIGVNGRLVELLGCQDEAEALALFEGGLAGITCEEDLTIARDLVRQLLERPGAADYRLLRIRRKSGEVANVAVNAQVSADPDGGRPTCTALLAEFVRHRPYDWLTGLSTKTRFGDYVRDMQAARAAGAPETEPTVAAFFDLTGFKSYNDLHGRPAGDKVLRLVARLLTATFGSDACARV